MTLEEACRLIDPATDLDALAEIEYYNGFKGKDAAAKALHEASQMVVDFVRQMSWHDAKNPPIAHEESWECAGEKHCAVISDIVWVCCESGHTMKGWVENGTWHIEDGHRAEDGHYGHVKLWAPLLEPPEVKKRKPSQLSMRFRRVVKVANSAEIFGAKRCASTIRFVLKPTDARLHRSTENRSVYCSTAGLNSRTKSVRLARKRVWRLNMTMEQLHFMVESPANFVRLACTILFEKREAMAEWAATWHDVFDCANGEQLFLQFMEELFPDGCTIGEKELNRITDRAVRYLQTETRCLDLKAGHGKSRFTYWVSFIPEHKVYGCEFARHEETIIEILTAFFGKSIAGYSLDALKRFILRSFEIRSDNSSVRSIAEDVDFIQRAVFARSFGNGRQEVPK